MATDTLTSELENDVLIEDTIKGIGKLGLNENKNWLDIHFKRVEHSEDWRNLQSTIMVPNIFKAPPREKDGDGRQTEKFIYDLLEEFGREYKEPMFVIHSHNFCELIDKMDKGSATTKEWIKGEYDFLIIHRKYGVIFMEVKSNKKENQVYKEAKDQIEKYRSAFRSFCRRTFGKSRNFKDALYNWPGFAVLPKCKKPAMAGFHEDVVYQEDCSSIESLQKWWNEKVVKALKKPIDQNIFEELVTKLVPCSFSSPTLNLQIDKTHENIIRLTPKQLESWHNSCPQQWIAGPAGSGKTVLLVEKVKEVAHDAKLGATKERILVLCFNRPLSVYLENEINGWFKSKCKTDKSPITIKTYDSFIKELGGYGTIKDDESKEEEFENRRKKVEAMYTDPASPLNPPEQQMYEHIFVDEGQDIPGHRWPYFLKKFHNEPDPTRKYYFWVMFDSNQHVQLTEAKNLPWQFLRNASQLTHVLRNTENIFCLSKKYYEGYDKAEIKLGHKEVGLNVTWERGLKEDKSNNSNKAGLVANHVTNLLNKQVQAKDIVILVQNKDSSCELTKDLNEHFNIRVVNAEQRLKSGANVITVESIRRFKGLESKVIILCDPECYPQGRIDKTRQLLYTAVSRCFCYLIIVSTPDGCRRIKNAQTHIRYSSGSGSEKRKSESSIEDLENEHKKQERHATFTSYGKRSRDNDYDSGPPERKEYVDKTDRDDGDDETIASAVKIDPMEEKRMQRDYERNKKSNQSRPLHVEGSSILEPGDEFIKDKIRSNVFDLLHSEVEKNLSFIGNRSFTDEDVKECVTFIEYDTYETYRTKRNPGPYTKAFRTLKREIMADTKKRVLNSEVEKALTQMRTEGY